MTQAVDIRAQTFCSLGTIISGNLADTYIQGSGLVFTRGSVELSGIYKPPVGTVVEFAYAKNGYIARLPRIVRVLSSFADPFRRKTTVQLGCLLTYLENTKPEIEEPKSRDENDVPCKVYDKSILPISASYVVSQILGQLGIASAGLSLTNRFSVEKFDLTPGFIKVLGDLLVSESYIGYIGPGEGLNYRNLSSGLGTGPVISNRNLIDISPIGVGDLPGDSVIVNYSSLRLTPPEEEEDEETSAKRSWEWEEVFGTQKEVTVTYTDDEGVLQEVEGNYYPYNFSATIYDAWDRAVQRLSYEQSSVAEVNSRWAADKYVHDNAEITLPAGRMQFTKWSYKIQAPVKAANLADLRSIFWNNGASGLKSYVSILNADKTEPANECLEEPPEGYEEIEQEETLTYISEAELAGTLNLDTYAFDTGNAALFGTSFEVVSFETAYTELESRTIVAYEKDQTSGITKTKITTELAYSKTTTGQQDLATLANQPPEIEDMTDFTNWINDLLNKARRLRSQGVELRIRTEREYGLQRRPSQEERNNTANQKPEVTEQQAEFVWALGSSQSINRIEFNMPYAPDDRISWTQSGGYTSTPSDAPQKALRFGRIQNRLLLGNRNGVSIQIPVELMPPRPFDEIYLEADNLIGMYRVNGVTYSFDSNGIVASADCLFWGGVA